jgi:hypothetical protein
MGVEVAEQNARDTRAISSAVASLATTVTGVPALVSAAARKPPTPPGPRIAIVGRSI